MTEYTFAEIPNMIKVLSDAVVSRATDKMINRAARTATGVSQGGTLVEGYVPFADGDLAGSLVSSLYGSTAMSQEGDTSYELVVGNSVIRVRPWLRRQPLRHRTANEEPP